MISPMQLVDNVRSLYTNTEQKELGQTSSDRVDWWKEIYAYTVEGPYFWTGKGYGVLLALVDHGGDWGLHLKPVSRSPHNAHINVLARSGVPGVILWFSVIIVTAGTALQGTRRNLKRGDVVLARVYLFLACYGSAALVDMTFDVFLEGPQGGIWFWSLVGTVIATREAERRMELAKRDIPNAMPPTPAATTQPAYY
jgi:O-antigen ligase